MGKKTAFITGIAGQDGSYLAEHLLSLDYEVCGIIRRNSTPEHQITRIDHLDDSVNIEYGDLLDPSSLERTLRLMKPNEIYNLASQSHVGISFKMPQFTAQVNALGVLNLLEIYKNNCRDAHFYQASSSEMFGNSIDEDGYQRITTPMNPISPYGCAKLFGYNIVKNYRKSYKLFACNGILFNHESPRRGTNFVTNKVVKAAVRIKLGFQDELELGNMDSYRDWGHSRDYVRAMQLVLSHSEPGDFLIATGEAHSVRDLCKYVFSRLQMNHEDYVVQNEKYMRPEELNYLRGDSSRAREVLGWTPTYTFEVLLDEMIEAWEVHYSEKRDDKCLL